MSSLLITGGTGTFGKALAKSCVASKAFKRIVIYSRDEQKQEEMSREIHDADERLRFFIGDVRDLSRLKTAMRGITHVVHAAALKIVPACEYNPIEAVKTNVHGSENVITAALESGVKKVVALSTDKAVAPVNLYGATKLTAERLFIAANDYGGRSVDFSIVRYGNVAASRGSVIPLFRKLAKEGKSLPVTHPEMTRFWITIDQAVNFVRDSMADMRGGEIFIPRMRSFRIMDLVKAFDMPFHDVGIRLGEKLHESLIQDEYTHHIAFDQKRFVILPHWLREEKHGSAFYYSSGMNDEWLSVDELREFIK